MPRWEQAGLGTGARAPSLRRGNTSLMHRVLQTPRKRKTRHSSNPPMECHVGWVMDSREHRPRTASIRYQRRPAGLWGRHKWEREGVWQGRGKASGLAGQISC